MRAVGRRLYSRARGAGSTFLPPATVETGCRYAYNLFGYLYQTNTAPCNTICSWEWVESRMWMIPAVCVWEALCLGSAAARGRERSDE